MEAYLGVELPAQDLFTWYTATGTFDAIGMGVPEARIGDALRVKGLPVLREPLSQDGLRSAIAKGYAVMAEVNPVYYWSPGDPMVDFWVDLKRRNGGNLADHLVWVIDVMPDAVVINDTALKDGAGAVVPWDLFSRSWAASRNGAIVVPRVLPPIDPDGDGIPFADQDLDHHASKRSGGDDCDDLRAAIHPGATEVPYNGVDDDCAGGDLRDSDGDGYDSTKARGTDCDDTNPAIHPGAEEYCYDLVDSDCIPDHFDTDCDGDGYAVAPAGADCDDTSPAIHPGAPEVCDKVDNDCDGAVDSADDNVAGPAAYWRDADGDGYGLTDTRRAGCTDDGPAGYATKGGDCNDDLADVSPGAAEACNDMDDDCNGLIDDGDQSLATEHVCYEDQDGDGHGRNDVSRRACHCPAGWVERRMDCNDSDPAQYMGCE